MFARHVTLKLKENSLTRLPRMIEYEILPLLRTQKGFRDEIMLVDSARSLVIGISLWNTKEDAQAYNQTGYSEVMKALAIVVAGSPAVETFEVETFEVASSTFYKAAAKAAGA
jgi:heme-degrading monooxygenase HmoA